LPSFIFEAAGDLNEGAALVLGEKASVRGTIKGDTMAVLLRAALGGVLSG